MRRNPLSLSLLFAATCFPPIVLAGPDDGDGGGQTSIMVGRYSTLETRPLPEQVDPLTAVVQLEYPAEIDTVGEALTQVLDRSGYRLAALNASCPSAPVLLALPLPAVHRTLGPLRLVDALKTLAGPTHHLVVDPVHRLASFEVREPYRELVAHTGARLPPMTVRSAGSPSIASPAQQSALAGDPAIPRPAGQIAYGPIKPNEQLRSIADAMRTHSSISVERMMIALLETNPKAFCLSNINCLKVGATLRPPDAKTLAAINDASARAEAQRQYAVWLRRAGVEPGETP